MDEKTVTTKVESTNVRPQPEYVRKIEAVPFDELFADSEDSYWDQDVRSDAEEYLDENVDRIDLSYLPFDPKTELAAIRKHTPEEASLSPYQRRKQEQERLGHYKDSLQHQKEGIAKIITDIKSIVSETPDISEDELMQRVLAEAPEYRLTESQLKLFKFAVTEYRTKHVAVEKYRQTYKTDDELFHACFGRMPQGKVEVIKGPMTLHFRCFNDEDYVHLYNYKDSEGDESKITDDAKRRTLNSQGVALSVGGKLQELAGTLTVERASNRMKTESRTENRQQALKNDSFVNLLDDQSEVTIAVKNKGTWKVKVVDRNPKERASRIQFFKVNERNEEMVFDISATEGQSAGFVDTLNPDGPSSSNMYVNFANDSEHGSWMSLDITPGFIKVYDHSQEGSVVTYQEKVEEQVIADELGSENTRIHEEQHQLNKLFTPLEINEDIYTLMRRSVESASNAEEAIDRLIHGLVRLERKVIDVDSRARDEILAMYRSNFPTDRIVDYLTKNENYDYKRDNAERIAVIPQQIQERVEENISDIVYAVYDDVDQHMVDANPLVITQEKVAHHVDLVFNGEYNQDVRVWTKAIISLEDKGYSREEVIDILSSEPVNKWTAAAKRWPQKQG